MELNELVFNKVHRSLTEKIPHIDAMLRESNSIIAGGSILSIIHDAPINDIDIYVNFNNLRLLLPRLINAGYNKVVKNWSYMTPPYDDSFLRQNHILGRFPLSTMVDHVPRVANIDQYGLFIDIIVVDPDYEIIPIVSNFDLTFCEIWYNGDNVFATHPSHVMDRRGVIRREYEDKLNSYNKFTCNRIMKYMDRGYEIYNDRNIKLTNQYLDDLDDSNCNELLKYNGIFIEGNYFIKDNITENYVALKLLSYIFRNIDSLYDYKNITLRTIMPSLNERDYDSMESISLYPICIFSHGGHNFTFNYLKDFIRTYAGPDLNEYNVLNLLQELVHGCFYYIFTRTDPRFSEFINNELTLNGLPNVNIVMYERHLRWLNRHAVHEHVPYGRPEQIERELEEERELESELELERQHQLELERQREHELEREIERLRALGSEEDRERERESLRLREEYEKILGKILENDELFSQFISGRRRLRSIEAERVYREVELNEFKKRIFNKYVEFLLSDMSPTPLYQIEVDESNLPNECFDIIQGATEPMDAYLSSDGDNMIMINIGGGAIIPERDVMCMNRNDLKRLIYDYENWYYECKGEKNHELMTSVPFIKMTLDNSGLNGLIRFDYCIKAVNDMSIKILYILSEYNDSREHVTHGHTTSWVNALVSNFGFEERHVSDAHCQKGSIMYIFKIAVCKNPVSCVKSLLGMAPLPT